MSLNYACQDGAMMLAEHRAFGDRMAAAIGPGNITVNDRNPDRRLRVGVLSGDLRRHSCSHFLLPLFAALDRREFDVWAISTNQQRDAVTEKFAAAADGWLSVAQLPYNLATSLIRDSRIDVLVECSGHTDGARLDICAARAAPVQMTFLGYPNTTGVDAVDYRLVDAHTDPPGAEAYCAEKLLRIPECLWCFRPADDCPEPGPLPAAQSGRITFGTFNALAKFSPDAVRAWSGILERLPDASLLIKNNRVHDPEILAALHARFAAHGIDPSRVLAVPYTKSTVEHLRVYERVDIQLDTFPYNGTTTTCESLWQGVPVLAVRGSVHAAKVSESLLNAVGLGDWVAKNMDEYVSRAVELSADFPRLAALRSELRRRMATSPLRDEHGYGARFGAVLRQAWKAFCGRGMEING